MDFQYLEQIKSDFNKINQYKMLFSQDKENQSRFFKTTYIPARF